MTHPGRSAPEGPWTKVGAIAGVVAVVLTYLGTAYVVRWPPFRDAAPPASATAAAPIRGIRLPDKVFEFKSLGHETRQSSVLGREQVDAAAYAYDYYQNDDGIWFDATAVAGGNSMDVIKDLEASYRSKAQAHKQFGPTTCVWPPDADPNTPRHQAVCFRVDERLLLGLVTSTHTADLEEIGPANLTDQLWNQLTLS
ncbi:hypothetical protein [Flindersiella endophytica]